VWYTDGQTDSQCTLILQLSLTAVILNYSQARCSTLCWRHLDSITFHSLRAILSIFIHHQRRRNVDTTCEWLTQIFSFLCRFYMSDDATNIRAKCHSTAGNWRLQVLVTMNVNTTWNCFAESSSYFETEILVLVFCRSSCMAWPWRPMSIPQ